MVSSWVGWTWPSGADPAGNTENPDGEMFGAVIVGPL